MRLVEKTLLVGKDCKFKGWCDNSAIMADARMVEGTEVKT